MRKDYDKLQAALKRRLPEALLEGLGRMTGFIRRQRCVTASDFLWAVVLSRFSSGVPGFDRARHLFNELTGSSIWPRPFQKRFKSQEVVDFFGRAFSDVVAQWRKPRHISHPLAKHFADIVAIDSTVTQLRDELGNEFKGQRGAAAEMKIALAVSVFGLVPLLAKLVQRGTHDGHLFSDLTALRKGSLLLADNAFISAANLRDAMQRGLSFVCPMRRHAHAQIIGIHHAPRRVRDALNSHPEGVPLRSLLHKTGRIGKVWDLEVTVRPTVGEDRSPVKMRLVIVPHKKGPRYYLTNLGPQWSPTAITELYRLRWQIELVFKELKQHLSLRATPTKDPFAAQVFIWASLIALAVSRTVSDCLTPLRDATGLQARHCVAVVSKTLRDFVGIMVTILTRTRSRAAATLLASLRTASTRPHRRRPDSFQMLEDNLPQAVAA